MPQEETESDDSELRAIDPARDVVQPVLGLTDAVNPPARFAAVAKWSIDYVEMEDPDPQHAYRGLLFQAHDASGETLYVMTVGWSGEASKAELGSGMPQPTEFVFDARPNADGSLPPVAFKLGQGTDQETLDAEQASFEWLQSERKRLLALIQAPAEPAEINPLAMPDAKDALFCAAHVVAFVALMTNPIFFFAVDGALDIAEGVLGGTTEEISHGAVKEGLAGVGYVVQKKVGEKAFNRGLLGVVTVGVGWNIYQEGLVGGLVKTASDIVPASCKRTAAAIQK